MMQLLTSRSPNTHDDEQGSLCAAHSHSGVQSRNITNTRIAYLRVCVCVCIEGPDLFQIFRYSRKMLFKTSTQLCVFCSEGPGESVSVSVFCFLHLTDSSTFLTF